MGESHTGETPFMDSKGRFAGILSPKIPDAATRDLAKAMLKIKGVKAIKTNSTAHRSRF